MSDSGVLAGVGRAASTALVVLMLGLPSTAHAAVEVTNLGPLTYVRNPGAPSVYSAGFPGLAGAAVLYVQNSGVSSAVIRLNGTEVVSPSAFNGQVRLLTVPVALHEQNRIEIELRSRPASSLTVRVTQAIEAAAAAVLGPSGGMMRVADQGSALYGASLSVPPGALQNTVLIWLADEAAVPQFPRAAPQGITFKSLSASATAGVTTVVSAITINPPTLVFSSPATLTLPYQELDLDTPSCLGEDSLSVFRYDPVSGFWTGMGTSPVDPLANTVSTPAIAGGLYGAHPDCFLCTGTTERKYLPVLLLHGWQGIPPDLDSTPFCNWGAGDTFGELPDLLGSEGAYTCQILYNSARGIRDNARLLRDKWINGGGGILARVQRDTGQRPGGVTVIAHSMGGLVARYAIQKLPPGVGTLEPIQQLVTLATPHLGTWAASPPSCDALRDMLPDSEFLEGSATQPTSGLNDASRVPNAIGVLPGCGPNYSFYAGDKDDIVDVRSALGQDWDNSDLLGHHHYISAIFEPPAIDASLVHKAETGTANGLGCGPDGTLPCNHITNIAGSLFGWGIADVHTLEAGIGKALREIVQNGEWFDADSAPQCTSQSSRNMLSNPSFEKAAASGTAPESWEAYSNAHLAFWGSVGAHSGNKAACVSLDGLYQTSWRSPTIPINAVGTYRFGGWAKRNGSAETLVDFTVIPVDASGGEIAGSSVRVDTSGLDWAYQESSINWHPTSATGAYFSASAWAPLPSEVCFDDVFLEEQTDADNLLANPSFELGGLTEPAAWHRSYRIDTLPWASDGHSGARSACASNGGTWGSPTVYLPSPGATYRLTGWAKSAVGSVSGGAIIQEVSDTSAITATWLRISATGSWAPFDFSVATLPSTRYLYVNLFGALTAVCFDEVEFKRQ